MAFWLHNMKLQHNTEDAIFFARANERTNEQNDRMRDSLGKAAWSKRDLIEIGANGKLSSVSNSPYEGKSHGKKRKQWFAHLLHSLLHKATAPLMHYTLCVCAQTKVLSSTWFYIFIILLLAWRFISRCVFFTVLLQKHLVRIVLRVNLNVWKI